MAVDLKLVIEAHDKMSDDLKALMEKMELINPNLSGVIQVPEDPSRPVIEIPNE